jgi:hypothetical protein
MLVRVVAAALMEILLIFAKKKRRGFDSHFNSFNFFVLRSSLIPQYLHCDGMKDDTYTNGRKESIVFTVVYSTNYISLFCMADLSF